MLLALAPVTIVCLLPLAWAAAAMLPGGVLVWIAAYFAVIPLAMIPGFGFLQVWLVGGGTRKPAAAEHARLAPAWQSVRARVGKGGRRRWRLRVIDTDDVNAAAAGGSLVMVTSYALRALGEAELRAVLAHELGHHVGLHPITLMAQSWLMRPIVWADWLTVRIHNAVGRVMNLSRMHMVVLILLLAVQLALRALAFVLQLIVMAAAAILRFFQRKAEHRADGTAVALGFGEGLLSALGRFEHAHPAGQAGRRHQWSDTHPSPRSRIARIRRQMRNSEPCS